MSILLIRSEIAINTEDIQDVKGFEYTNPQSDELSEGYVIRVNTQTPQIDFICHDIKTAKYLYRSIVKSQRVIDINSIRGK